MANTIGNSRIYNVLSKNTNVDETQVKTSVIYVPSDVPLKYINSIGFSTRAGSAEEVKSFGFFGNREYGKDYTNLIRGIFTPFLGTNARLTDNAIYNVRIQNYSTVFEKEYFEIRGNDNSEFVAITDRYELEHNNALLYKYKISDNPEVYHQIAVYNTGKIYKGYNYIDGLIIEKIPNSKKISIIVGANRYVSEDPIGLHIADVYRGDCFTSTVTLRMNRNFIDSETPTNETIVDPNTWKNSYNGYSTTDPEKWLDINRADINAVPMGTWVTFKCLSNTNLGLRSQDTSHVNEIEVMGNPRTFYPLTSVSPNSPNKIEESHLLNDGYGSTLGHKRNYTIGNVPYIKDLFDNRIMFSNVQIDDDFRNAYRIFQGLSYKDIDRQYGAIVKLIPWGVNLFCVFEHGLGIIPINEKALISTNTGQSVHMYGAGVIQNQITLISPDYGSIWPESVYLTPIGIYGVDTHAKKIWRYTDKRGLELLSDTKIQRFLNDNILLAEKDKYTTIALKNVKTHYNNYKGDVMFTFYNQDEEALWNVCYNERLDKWITKYSWTPLCSENVNNVFYSLDKKRAEILAYVYDNQHTEVGLRLKDGQNEWDISQDYNGDISTVGYEFYDKFNYEVKKVSSSYMDGDNEVEVSLPTSVVSIDTSNIYIEKPSLKTSSTGVHNFYNYRLVDGVQTYDPVAYTTSDNNYIIDVRAVRELYYSYTTYDQNITTTVYEKVPDENFVYAKLSIPKETLIYEGNQLYYLKVAVDVTPVVNIDGDDIFGSTFTQPIGLVAKRSELIPTQRVEYDLMLTNGFYVHGRAGIFDELDYLDQDPLNNIQPTKWYDKQEPFEFEFVVNQPTGLHKIFNDLVIISNNVEPESLEIEIVGDVYHFNKESIFKKSDPDIKLPKIILNDNPRKEYYSTVEWDNVLNQYSLRSHQDCLNINTYGRRLGNIQYVEDSWRTVIEPIYYTDSTDTDGLHTTRIRDKYAKIRIKYSGEKLAVIMAIQTLLSISYA